MGKLILIRHGETRFNLEKKVHAVGDPELLNDVGKVQMQKAGKELSKLKLTKLYSSKEKRTIESAEIISEITGTINIPLEGLQERNWGRLAGKSWTEISEILDKLTLEERYNYVPPEGESWKDFEKRSITAINFVTQNSDDKVVAVVTHGGPIRALMPYLLSVPKEESFKYDFDNASLTIFDFDGNKFKNVSINSTDHLS